ncbi:lipid II flippase MurJ [Thalassobaculum sp.]|uniref:murein biosynthesis integral membrane protein MurJ n=1 Tax=Thalassobaculum sp. TaxID=2022740 RepID=UPI0032EE12C3
MTSEASVPAHDDDRAVARAGLTIGLLSVVAKLTAFVREATIAAVYGRGPEVDAFFLALAVPVFLLALIAGSFQIALVPAYLARRRAAGEAAADTLFAAGLGRMLVAVAAGTLVMAAAAPLYLPWLAPSFAADTLTLTADLLWIMTLFVVLGAGAVAWGGVLNARRRFALPAIAPAFTPLVMAILLLVARDRLGISALAWGAVLGTAIEAALVGGALRRLGGRLLPVLAAPDLAPLLGRWGPILLANLLLYGAGMLDQMMAALLGPGAASAIGYGAKLVLAGLHVATLAIGVAVLPAYSDQAAAGDEAALRMRLRRHLAIVVGLSVPAVVAAWLLAEPVIRVLYQRGAFGPDDTALVAEVLAAYAVQLPAYAATVVLVRAAAVLGLGRALAAAAAANLALTVALNAGFMALWGVVGIALATTPAFMATAFVLYVAVIRTPATGRR